MIGKIVLFLIALILLKNNKSREERHAKRNTDGIINSTKIKLGLILVIVICLISVIFDIVKFLKNI